MEGRSHAWLVLLLATSIAQAACGGPAEADESIGEDASAAVMQPPPGPDEPDTRPDGGGPLAPLGTIKVPRPVGGDIVDKQAAIALGKAFFWDTQVGPDGKVACATCHFAAGADNRRLNTINPGVDGTFQSVSAAGQLFDGSPIASDDKVGSQGVVGGTFVSIQSRTAVEMCSPDPAAPFFDNRRVTDRNTPSVIGAVFNRVQFWDGRASGTFNGLDPFGTTGNESGSLGSPVEGASLASQSVGPPVSSTEMTCAGRPFNGPNSLAAKMVDARVLVNQRVHPFDSVLGRFTQYPATGLDCLKGPCTYRQMIAKAFGNDMARNAVAQFSRIWGQAIQAYESTLIPDQTPLDRFLAGNTSALTARQQQGLAVFTGRGGCTLCHAGPELTDASVGFAIRNGTIFSPVPGIAIENGFHHLGVRPPEEDLGRMRTGPNGIPFGPPEAALFDNGAFKTPGLRNVKLTPPYFHNGGFSSIEEVVDFYDRGGDFPTFAIRPLGLTQVEKEALVDFLANGLTDCRVEKLRAPFDHPSLDVPNGPGLFPVGKDGTGPCP